MAGWVRWSRHRFTALRRTCRIFSVLSLDHEERAADRVCELRLLLREFEARRELGREATEFQVENIRWAYVFYESGLSINVLYQDHPEIQNEGMQYEGFRFRAECKLAGKVYGQPLGVDIAFGDPVLGEPEIVVAEDVLAFVGIAPPTLRLYPIETHIAEKLHAYTMPRSRPNSRVKDLPDLALLATTKSLDARRLRAALGQTFSFRKTHPLPDKLPDPPAS
jgi:hypothetical protein